MTPKELWIIQPYTPQYRVSFFEQLREHLRNNDVDLHIVAGEPNGDQASRGDSAYLDWVEYVKPRSLKIGPAIFELGSTRKYWKNSDAVIVPHMGTSRDAFSALVGKRVMKVGVWGHINSYVAAPNLLDLAIEGWQLRRADHVFAYTPGGAQYAEAVGVPTSRITTVMNTLDTNELETNLREVTEETIRDFRHRHGIPNGPFFAFIGGLDSSKRIDFLAETMDELFESGSDIHLVVGGSGVQARRLEKAVMRGQVTLLGYVSGSDKANLLSASAAVVCPGRVGLLAIDALIAQRAILTTNWKLHAPEHEYLIEGISVLSSLDSPSFFAQKLQSFASNSEGNQEHTAWIAPGLQQMVNSFARGVIKMLETKSSVNEFQ